MSVVPSPPPPARFEGRVQTGHKEAAIEVPFDPADRWGVPAVPIRPGRRGVAVRATIAGQSFDSFVVARSRRFWLLVDDARLTACGIAPDDVVSVALQVADAG